MGVKFTYRAQDEAGGIAQALALAEDFAGNEKIAAILGDNLFSDNLSEKIGAFEKSKFKACLFLKEVDDPERFGVAEIRDKKIVGLEEKPSAPKSRYAVTGLYLYTPHVFSVIKTIKPSKRGELEITEVNDHYVRRNEAEYHVLEGDWTDTGTFESMYRATTIARKKVVGK
jgi:glucose-1-phosphate thymidylyltransferase